MVEEMEKARERVKVGRNVNDEEKKRGWPELHIGDMVTGQRPRPKDK